MKMKKNIIVSSIFILLFGCFFAVKNVVAKSSSEKFYQVLISSYHYVFSNGKYGDFALFRRVSDDELVYSIEPGVDFSSASYDGYYDLLNSTLAEYVNLTEEELHKVSLIAYFGFGYKQHQSLPWIVATQSLIWQELGGDFKFTSSNNASDPWKNVIDIPNSIQLKMNEIEKLVTEYENMASLSLASVNIPYGISYTYGNDYISKFNVNDCTNCNAYIENNELHIETDNLNSGEVSLIREENLYDSSIIVYKSTKGENMLSPGKISNIEKTLSYDVVAGSLTLENYDSTTKSCNSSVLNASLTDSVYKLYNEDGTFVTDLVIDSNCEAKVDYLKLGKYYLVQEKSGDGYTLDNNYYDFELTLENPTISKTIYSEIKKYDLNINVSYLTEDGLKSEENKEFIIYPVDDKENITKLITDENGTIKTSLTPGEYILHQEKTLKDYYLVDDVEINISNNSDSEYIINLVNNPYKAKLNLINVDLNNEVIKKSGFKYKIYDMNKNSYVCSDNSCIYETSENGDFTTQELFPSSYRIEQIDDNIDGYLWNEENIYFEIGEDSPFIKDEDGNLLFRVYFKNYNILDEEESENINEDIEPVEEPKNINDSEDKIVIEEPKYTPANKVNDIKALEDNIVLSGNDIINSKLSNENSEILDIKDNDYSKIKSAFTFIIGLLFTAIGLGSYNYKKNKE
jgi:hypothetical protein